ncbi:hypothetical protein JFV28_15925 [Pseudomonas sp. TH05]|uniref:hypothetical protein n=1 Tax=unclassified Pseudomonas TaxID=196821 RepID=UPI0009971393|nr:hypothetical protein [Pseudomonas sp. MF4836]MBK5541101.1 hypothetical protein [Pseudomonas sp. TH07]MBK5557343.1 hypothetical protein [Pseudomonas sp. TH05]OOV92966.1 hypothetical protein MF4836_22985 [Pseudomonas sp. MF4836]
MGNINQGLTRLLLIGCAVSAAYCLPVQAAGDGVIVLERTVHPQPIGRQSLQPDPYPTTVNANPSARINGIIGGSEMTDGDFAGVNSGALIRNTIMPSGGHVPGLNVVTNPNGLPGMSAGHGGGSGASISNSINRSISAGMAPLSNIGGQ